MSSGGLERRYPLVDGGVLCGCTFILFCCRLTNRHTLTHGRGIRFLSQCPWCRVCRDPAASMCTSMPLSVTPHADVAGFGQKVRP